MNSLKREVLKCFKTLHRARQSIFQGDEQKLYEVRHLINEGFRKNVKESDEHKIKEQIKFGYDVEYEMKTTIIQAVETQPNILRLNIRPEVRKIENKLFNENAVLEDCPKQKCS